MLLLINNNKKDSSGMILTYNQTTIKFYLIYSGAKYLGGETSSSSSSTVRVVIFSDCRLSCVLVGAKQQGKPYGLVVQDLDGCWLFRTISVSYSGCFVPGCLARDVSSHWMFRPGTFLICLYR